MGSPHVICYMFCMQGTPASKPTGTRMTKLTDQQKEDIMNMAGPACMDSQERKRQYSAMGWAITKSCSPTLLAKYSLCSDGERCGLAMVDWNIQPTPQSKFHGSRT